jgi:hypothetical protein
MDDSAFSDDFCEFIRTAIPTVDAAELLLLLCGQADASWEPAELVGKLRPAASITDADAARYLEIFQARGLVAVGPDKRIRYRPGSGFLAAHVRTLAQAYKERPVTLIHMIYALRDARVQSFADAFKLKRK